MFKSEVRGIVQQNGAILGHGIMAFRLPGQYLACWLAYMWPLGHVRLINFLLGI